MLDDWTALLDQYGSEKCTEAYSELIKLEDTQRVFPNMIDAHIGSQPVSAVMSKEREAELVAAANKRFKERVK